MPQRCIVAGCSNTTKDGYSLHCFPRDPKVRKIWTQKVKTTRAKWSGPTESSVVCSAHFRPEDYQDPGLYADFNISHKKRLKVDAVPTIFPKGSGKMPLKRTGAVVRPGAEKRRKMRVSKVDLTYYLDPL